MKPPNPSVGTIEVDPVGYKILLARGEILIDGQRARVHAIAYPADDQQNDLVVMFDRPYVPPLRRIICEEIEQARRYIDEGIIVLEGKPYVPRPGDEPHIVVLLPFRARGLASTFAFFAAYQDAA